MSEAKATAAAPSPTTRLAATSRLIFPARVAQGDIRFPFTMRPSYSLRAKMQAAAGALRYTGSMDMYDGLARAYDEIFPTNPATLERLSDFGIGPGSRVLDLGCATGGHVLALARRGVLS